MEVLTVRLLFILTWLYGALARAEIPETNGSQHVSELKDFLTDKIHEIENRYEEKLEALRDEMMRKNEMLQKSVDELNTKLESERREKSNAIQQLRKDFVEKETELTVEVKNLKTQLMTECNDSDRDVDLLKAMLIDSMPEVETDLNGMKEKGDVAPKSASMTKDNQAEDVTKHGFKRQTAYGSRQVAFSSRLSKHYTPSLNSSQGIIFNDVLLNVGSAYYSTNGTFIAPVSGVYLFTTSILAYGTSSHHARIVKNGQELAKIDFNDDDNFDHSSQTVIVKLERGHVVAVENVDVNGMVYFGYNYSTFSGFLLYEYEDVAPVVGK